MDLSLGLHDVFTAAIWATVIFVVVKVVSHLFKNLLTRTMIHTLRPDQLDEAQKEAVFKSCHYLFPIEIIKWQGKTYHRGSLLRVSTSTNATIIGRFVGINSENMLCIITQQSIVAQEIDSISEITQLDNHNKF